MSDSESIESSNIQSEEEAQIEIDRMENILQKQEIYAHKLSCEKPFQSSVSKEALQSTSQDSLCLLFTEIEEQLDHLLKQAQRFTKFLINGANTTQDNQTTFLLKQPKLNGNLKSYQLAGLNWMIGLYENGINGILADQMGLGKTIQTIALISYLAEYKKISGPHLIIGPLSTIGNWAREIKKWLPNCRIIKFSGQREEKEAAFELMKNTKFDVILTSYEGAFNGFDQLIKFKFHYFVIDEAHKLKNDETLLREALIKIKTRNKLLLTGTPLQNNPHELWSLLNFIMPKLFVSSGLFDNWFEINNQIAKQDKITEEYQLRNLQLIDKVKQIIKPFMLRRTKQQVEYNLPPKKEIHIYLQMTPLQKELYCKIILEKQLNLNDKMLNNRIMHLRKMCLHPYLFPNIEDPNSPPLGEHLINTSGKMKVLDMFLAKLYKEKHKVLIFSQFTKMLNILEDYCNFREYSFCRIDGDTKVADRDSQIEDFQDEKSDIFIFMLSTRAGGLGITLTAADTVILYDSDFNPQIDMQAMDRAHRIGQKNPVMVYRLVCKSTVEEKMIERQQIRLRWESLIIESGGKACLGSQIFKKEDLKNLTYFGVSEILKDDPYTEEDIDTLLKRGEELTDKLNTELDKRFNIIQKQQNQLDLGLKSINMYDYFQDKTNTQDLKALQEKMEQIEQMEQNGRLSQMKGKQLSKILRKVQIQDFQFYPKEYHSLKQKQLDWEQLQNLLESNVDFEMDIDIEQLTENELQQLDNLNKIGFNWTKYDFQSFTDACLQFGRSQVDAIAEQIQKPVEEVEKYIQTFNERYNEIDDMSQFIIKLKNKEKLIEQNTENAQIFSEFSNIFEDCRMQTECSFREKNKLTPYTQDNDNLLIWAINQAGYGNWNKILDLMLQDQYSEYFPHFNLITSNVLKFRAQFLVKIIQNFLKKRKNTEIQKSVNNLIIDEKSTDELQIKPKSKSQSKSKSKKKRTQSKKRNNSISKQKQKQQQSKSIEKGQESLLDSKFKLKKVIKK